MSPTQKATPIRLTALAGAVLALHLNGSLHAAPVPRMPDGDITAAVTTDLIADDAVMANEIDVSTEDGIVTLEGSVDSMLKKERAAAHARATRAVRAVVNRVKIRPLLQISDKDLAKAIEDAWLADPATEASDLEVSVEDGVVTISGTADSFAEKSLASDVAKRVPGVIDIRNRIQIEYDTDRADAEIASEVKARLENDVRVDDRLIQVGVKNGIVSLSGTVGSLQEKNRAGIDAWVAGVQAVNTDALAVDWARRDPMRRVVDFVSRTDIEIEQAVKDAFRYDPRVLSFQPRVAVNEGTVTLSGVVDNLMAKRAAGQDARNTLGVWRVHNQLKVRPKAVPDDEIEARVASALLANPYVERFDIDVDARNGWVYLSGVVNTSFESEQAAWAAERVQGVVGVVNNVTYDYRWRWKPDWEIREDVKDQFFWSPFVDAEDINISVDNGVVSLTGSVSSWSEFEDAEKNAYQAGAKEVENNLVVRYPYYGPYGPDYFGSPLYRGGASYRLPFPWYR